MTHSQEHLYDVLIVGSGISGLNTAYHLQQKTPNLSYAILESRSNVGGTWDLFRYPGIRSDTDLHTFGFAWSPWRENRAIAHGDAIARYLSENATKQGIDKHVMFQHHVQSANWTSANQIWTLDVEHQERRFEFQCRFLILSTGYYDYKEPLKPVIPGLDDFSGQVVHPQFWPEDLDYVGKRIVIIGSGATAITLLPNLAKRAAQVTMLQRSPGYIMSINNATGNSWYHKIMPWSWSFQLDRWMFMWLVTTIFYFCRAFPNKARKILEGDVAKLLPAHISMDPHFQPRYQPWDERVCFTPNGDFFEALRESSADVATGEIKTIKGETIVLESGQGLAADIIITATGLKLRIGGRIQINVENKPVKLEERYTWRSCMLEGIPNFAFIIGYVNAPWTLGAEVTAILICRLLRFMEKKALTAATPSIPTKRILQPRRLWNLDSTYVKQAAASMPKCGNFGPWVGRKNYFWDLWRARFASLSEGMRFSSAK